MAGISPVAIHYDLEAHAIGLSIKRTRSSWESIKCCLVCLRHTITKQLQVTFAMPPSRYIFLANITSWMAILFSLTAVLKTIVTETSAVV